MRFKCGKQQNYLAVQPLGAKAPVEPTLLGGLLLGAAILATRLCIWESLDLVWTRLLNHKDVSEDPSS